jgi:hypothetical protein
LCLSLHRDEGETLKDPTDDDSQALSAFVKTPAKTVIPEEEIVESPKSTTATKSLMSTHASILVDSVEPSSAEVCRTATNFP